MWNLNRSIHAGLRFREATLNELEERESTNHSYTEYNHYREELYLLPVSEANLAMML